MYFHLNDYQKTINLSLIHSLFQKTFYFTFDDGKKQVTKICINNERSNKKLNL